ncbi:Exonuclease III [Rubritalea squalenifaciens DSM 18772]|uniref:Exonuclease III n=1 Tax=Rubritalea squalenifaciens DSM 18772 TaxID=1123071 RepID=A0A1M6EKE7_9BACT|nr:endonuclease/exonuclease/phosphatase family protein [Rubritalea squalenifaciens]SHI85866.1 Exonuclease III [Rubritalea squalenifaciens DSM 18772]
MKTALILLITSCLAPFPAMAQAQTINGIHANTPPTWVSPSFRRVHGVANTAYSGKVSAYATDLDKNDSLSFSKVDGPSWLTVATNGEISGTPTEKDSGINSFTIRATDLKGSSADATLKIPVHRLASEKVTELKIMSFNMWRGLGWINDGYRKGLNAIILSDADVIGIQEGKNTVSSGEYILPQLARDLGWHYTPEGYWGSGIISRYPITETFKAGIATGARIQLTNSPTNQIILFNCHLHSAHPGAHEAQKAGSTVEKVLKVELRSQRHGEITTILKGMDKHLTQADKTPVLLVGDFNAPSHLDWNEETAPQHGGIGKIAWPVSTACINAKLKDSFRMIHPDPKAKPGNTWSPLYLKDPQDRIDHIYYRGSSLKPLVSQVFHTKIETTLGIWKHDVASNIASALNNTWPSDHAAVITTFSLN